MLRTLSLLWPVIFPSWRFFQTVEPSPRLEWAAVCATGDVFGDWREVHPIPARMPVGEAVRRLVWNPDRNAALFIINCAERIQAAPTDHSIGVIQRYVQAQVGQRLAADQMLQFRLVFVHRDGEALVRDVAYRSPSFAAIAAQTC